jgi:hypothetical protein
MKVIALETYGYYPDNNYFVKAVKHYEGDVVDMSKNQAEFMIKQGLAKEVDVFAKKQHAEPENNKMATPEKLNKVTKKRSKAKKDKS